MSTTWIEETPELLSVAEMYRADAAAAEAGVPGLELMETAGAAVAEAVADLSPDGRVVVLCGPGNNGGDGFVAARLLAAQGREVRLALLGDVAKLRGDAAAEAALWKGGIEAMSPGVLDGAWVVIDAMFGAGLARPLDGIALDVVNCLNASDLPCVAVDVPSGVNGDTGQVAGSAPRANVTVTFYRRKPGHLLYPGRGLCGRVRVADIGTPERVLESISPAQWENSPVLWRAAFPRPDPQGHKYARGHALVSGGRELTGAARLAAHAALRAGAGLVSIAAHRDALDVYRAGRPALMVREVTDALAFGDALADPRMRACLVGPGNGVTEETASRALAGIASGGGCVIDADAITVFAGDPDRLFAAIAAGKRDVVLTPHDGEFARLFSTHTDAERDGKLEAARTAALVSGAVVVFKGADTVVAAPDGRAAIGSNAPPELATAGSGDVLAGFITGLLAQGMSCFDAAAAGVWLHGAAAAHFGPGLIAEDIADALPPVLRDLRGILSRTPSCGRVGPFTPPC